jgi:hypothetical protein
MIHERMDHTAKLGKMKRFASAFTTGIVKRKGTVSNPMIPRVLNGGPSSVMYPRRH